MSAVEIYEKKEIDNYDPSQGLKAIAVAEAGEGFFKRARNSDGLYEAVKTKLVEQRRFIKWWDAQKKDKGGGDVRNTAHRSVSGVVTIASVFDIPPDDDRAIHATEMMLSRWRRALSADESFAMALADAQLRCKRICEQEKITTVRGTEGTGEFDLYTPEEYISAAREVLGEIDLDPASSDTAQKIVRAKTYFTVDDDGLSKEWRGRVWLNPPYHRELLPDFVRKLVDEYKRGNINSAIMLTNNCTDTDWFLVAHENASSICFTHGRVKFYRPNNEIVAPTQGQAFFYFGQNSAEFAKVFMRFGIGVTPAWLYSEEA